MAGFDGKTVEEVLAKRLENQRGEFKGTRTYRVHNLRDGRTVLQAISVYAECNRMGSFDMFGADGLWRYNFDRFGFHNILNSATVHKATHGKKW